MEAFIEGVRAEPCLWNPSHADYRETHLKDEAWERVIEKFDRSIIPNIQSAKMEWKKLRDNHRDALKRAKLGKNKLLPAQITTWKYAKAMQFLEPHMKYRITEHIEMDPLPPAKPRTEVMEQDNVTTTEASNAATADCPFKKLKRRSNNTSMVPLVPQDPTDSLDAFFKCALQTTREMPQWMQTQVKKKIFAVIIEAEEYLAQGRQEHYNESLLETSVKSEVETDEEQSNYMI